MTMRELKMETRKAAALKTMGPRRITWSFPVSSLWYHIALVTIVMKRRDMQHVRRCQGQIDTLNIGLGTLSSTGMLRIAWHGCIL